MTPERFQELVDFLRERVGVSARWLAAAMLIDDRTFRRMYEGRYPVPETLGEWLERIMAFYRANPRPGDVRELAEDDELMRLIAHASTAPGDEADWIERAIRFHRANPVPPHPTRRPGAGRDSPRGSSPP